VDQLLLQLATPQASDTITALPRAEVRAIVQAILTPEADYRELRCRMRDLNEPLDALLARLQPSLGADNALQVGSSRTAPWTWMRSMPRTWQRTTRTIQILHKVH
jgi:hypothetical protein